MVGRKKEMEMLLNAYESPQSELVAIYGRRRVGKTYLVNEVFGRHFAFHHSGLKKGGLRQQLKQFQLSLRQQGYWDCPNLKDWQEAFFELGNFLSAMPEGRKVVFIDEMPWLDTFRSNFIMAFEGFWNGWATFRTDILLVICGSATTWILKKVVHNRDGLHNRLTARIRLNPFTLHECREYAAERLLEMDERQIAECYMAFGGVAYYWSLLEKGKSADQNINDLFFGRREGLQGEFDELYDSLFSISDPYKAIVEALGGRKSGMTRYELLESIDKGSGGDISRQLEELEECGFIRKYENGGKAVKGAIYQLMDNFTLFYFQFVRNAGRKCEDYWMTRVTQAQKNAWRGLSFERLCLEHLPQMKKALGISGVSTDAYAWRYSGTGSDEHGIQIDLLIDRNDGIVNLCEMKFSELEYELTKEEFEKLISRKEIFAQKCAKGKSIYLTMVTVKGLKHNLYRGHIQCEITLADLFESA